MGLYETKYQGRDLFAWDADMERDAGDYGAPRMLGLGVSKAKGLA
jgi:hypothetical protein